MDFATGTYTGDDSTPRSFSGLGFTPVVVGIIRRDATFLTVWKTPDMSTTDSFTWFDQVASNAQMIRSLDLDGFTVGSDAYVNANTATYLWWALSADSTGLATGTYAGDGTDDRDIPVPIAPDIVIVQETPQAGLNANHCFLWVASQGGDSSADIEADQAAAGNQIQGAGASGFQVGTALNEAAKTYYWVALKRKDDNIIEGVYTGDGADSRNITFVGDSFTPSMVLVKHAITGLFFFTTYRTSVHTGDTALTAQQGEAANLIQALNSNGFQVGTSVFVNGNTNTYWYVAFAPGPSTASAALGTPSATPSPFEFPDTPYAWYKMGLDILNTYKSLKIR